MRYRSIWFLAALLCAPAYAAQWEVNNAGNSGTGTLRAAVEAVNAAVDPADQYDIVFRLSGDGVIVMSTPLPVLNKRLVRIIGHPAVNPGVRPRLFGPEGTSIVRLSASSEEIEISNLSIEGGSALEGGCLNAGALAPSALLIIEDVTFNDCAMTAESQTLRGGALFARGEVSVLASHFIETQLRASGNGIAQGGAIALAAGNLYVQDTMFSDATVQAEGNSLYCGGGAIWISSGDLTVIDSQFAGSTADCAGAGLGGAIGHEGHNLLLRGVHMRGSFAQVGGAVWYGPVEPTSSGRIENSVFIDNRAVASNADLNAYGGALFVRAQSGRPSMIMRNATFARNGAHAGLGAHLADSGATWTSVHSNVFADALPAFNGGAVQSCLSLGNTTFPTLPGYNFATDASCSGFPGTQNVAAAALQLAYQQPLNQSLLDVHVLAGSVAIDAGSPEVVSLANPAACLPTDLDGISRPRDGNGDNLPRCDAGAREFVDALLFANGFEG